MTDGYERIDWQAGDVIRIYSNEAKHRYENQNWADYKITTIEDPAGRYSKAKAAPNGGNGLIWGDPGTYHFYGVYPSGASGSTGETGFSVTGNIAANQGQWNNQSNKIPTYGYMIAFAKQTVSADDTEAPLVDLDFNPAFTAFTIDLKSKDRDITITKFELISEDVAIAGPFSASVSESESGQAMDFSFSGATDKTVSVTFAEGTVITTEQNLQFTVFALPRDMDKLSIRFTILSDDPDQTQTHTLKLMKKQGGEMKYINFAGCAKHNITGVQMEGSWSFKTITLNGEVIEWTETEVSLASDDLPQASQFEVSGARNVYSDLHPDNVEAREKYRQTWVIAPERTATVTFKIFSPVGGTYEIKPMNSRGFTVEGDLSGRINRREDEGVTTVNLTITPTSPSAGQELWFKVNVTNKDGETFSIDSETQLFDLRGYHKFRIDDPLQ